MEEKGLKQRYHIQKRLWIFYGVFIIVLILFFSLVNIVIARPAIYNHVDFLTVRVQKYNEEKNVFSEQTTFAKDDIIKLMIEYKKAQEGTKASLFIARLTTNPKVQNAKQILVQKEVTLLSGDGQKTYEFPAFERQPARYEVSLQDKEYVIAQQLFTIE